LFCGPRGNKNRPDLWGPAPGELSGRTRKEGLHRVLGGRTGERTRGGGFKTEPGGVFNPDPDRDRDPERVPERDLNSDSQQARPGPEAGQGPERAGHPEVWGVL